MKPCFVVVNYPRTGVSWKTLFSMPSRVCSARICISLCHYDSYQDVIWKNNGNKKVQYDIFEYHNTYVLHFFEKVTFLMRNDPIFCRETFPKTGDATAYKACNNLRTSGTIAHRQPIGWELIDEMRAKKFEETTPASHALNFEYPPSSKQKSKKPPGSKRAWLFVVLVVILEYPYAAATGTV